MTWQPHSWMSPDEDRCNKCLFNAHCTKFICNCVIYPLTCHKVVAMMGSSLGCCTYNQHTLQLKTMSGPLLRNSALRDAPFKYANFVGLSKLLGSGLVYPTSALRLARSPLRPCHAAAPIAEPATEVESVSNDGRASSNGTYKSTAYPFTDIEAKWQAYWEEHQTFRTPEFKDLDTSKPKFYALDMFPYPR